MRARDTTVQFLKKSKISCLPGEGNFFMMEVGASAPEPPTPRPNTNVSFGTQEEMNKFAAALTKSHALT